MSSSTGQYCRDHWYVTTHRRLLFKDKASLRMEAVLSFEI